ncbi:arrest-specific 2-like [Octopus vulgaris]|uniref:Arrest-specific 2-like n=2 Tax=Octopus TaxID=6643 RepID=A0AA36FHB1_OCTVU|nr:growth arrest-specific protein 2 isoform X2 [Octopus sinensis]CAI9738680.1 arrest-specific 2-like [Octopus vulgaris]
MHSPTSLDTVLCSPLIEESEVEPINMAFSLVNGDADSGVGNKLDFYPAVDEEYESRRAEQQAESLVPLKEDLADWLQRILDLTITTETFMEALDNGAALCRLAHLIQLKAEAAYKEGKYTEPIPRLKFRYRENAKSGTWFARDNAATFLRWCRDFGINEGCMFESEDLVCHRQEKPVVVCLLELARIGYKFGLESPSIIKIEKEIEREESELASQINEEEIQNLSDLANLSLPMESVATQVSRTASLDTNVEEASQNEASQIEASENEASSRKATADGEEADDEGEGEAEGDGDGDAEGDGEADEVDEEGGRKSGSLEKTEVEAQEASRDNDEENEEEQKNSVNGEETGEAEEAKEDEVKENGEKEEDGDEGEEGEIESKGSMMLNGEDDFTQSNEGIVSQGGGDEDDEQDTNASRGSGSTSMGEDGSNLKLNSNTLEDINENDAEPDSVESKTAISPLRNNDIGTQFHKKTLNTPQARVDSLKARQLDKKLLKEKHLMVRVGGGWDTLEHYLSHHNPTKIIEFKRTDQPKASSTSPRHDPDTGETALTSAISSDDKYLLILGKYKKN